MMIKKVMKCPFCGEKLKVSADFTLISLRPQDSPKKKCYYKKTNNGWVTGCGRRIAYNSHMNVCPYCTKPIICFSKEEEN